MAEDYGVRVTTQTVNDLRHKFVDPLYAGDEAIVPMAAGAAINAGYFVCTNTSGYAVPGADTAGYRFIGVALETKDNSAGNNGDLLIRVRRRSCFLMTAASITQAMVGNPMYVKTATSFDDADGCTNDIKAGILVGYVSATKGWIDINK